MLFLGVTGWLKHVKILKVAKTTTGDSKISLMLSQNSIVFLKMALDSPNSVAMKWWKWSEFNWSKVRQQCIWIKRITKVSNLYGDSAIIMADSRLPACVGKVCRHISWWKSLVNIDTKNFIVPVAQLSTSTNSEWGPIGWNLDSVTDCDCNRYWWVLQRYGRLFLFHPVWVNLLVLVSGLINLRQNIYFRSKIPSLMKLPQSTPRSAKPSALLNLGNIRFTEVLVPEAIWVQFLHRNPFTLIFSHGFIEKYKGLNPF